MEGDPRQVVPREDDRGSICRKSRSKKRKSQSKGSEMSWYRKRNGANSGSDTGRVIRKVAPDEKQRANNDRIETATEGDTRQVVPRGEDVGNACRKSSSKKRKSTSHNRSQSRRGSSLARVALWALLSSPRVRLVDSFPLSVPRSPGSHGNSGEGDYGDVNMSSPGGSVSPVTDDRTGHPVFSEISDPAEGASYTPVSSMTAISTAESSGVESFIGWVSVVPAGSSVSLRSPAQTPACQCLCHNRQGSCCPCRCVCSHRDAACHTT